METTLVLFFSEADVFKIRFVRIFDNDLAADFSLYQLPALVYFRNEIPVVYEGDLKDEAEVLEWLIQHQTSIDEEDVVEKATKVNIRVFCFFTILLPPEFPPVSGPLT